MNIIIRDYKLEDAEQLVDIFYNTIHRINIKDYTHEQADAWAPEDSLNINSWITKWEKLKPIVAELKYEDNNKILGFTEFNNKTGYIDCFFCHHNYIKQGVGSLLMKEIVKQARANNLAKIYADVSITARSFFEAKGFCLIKQQIIERKGVKLKNNIMEKYFT